MFFKLLKLELPNRRNTIHCFDALDSWENKKITNFEYLTQLNKVAGRSFNDLMQYPVMPFILQDYTSSKIDLRDISIYRDLSKPMSVQDQRNEKKFKNNYDVSQFNIRLLQNCLISYILYTLLVQDTELHKCKKW